jgi:hypoxanthine phosphoribosyltransferase
MLKELDLKIQALYPKEIETINLIGIPRGGLLVALHLSYLSERYEILDPDKDFTVLAGTTVLVDDVLEKGETLVHWQSALRNRFQLSLPFAVLVDKSLCYYGHQHADVSVLEMDKKEWVTFPYEREGSKQEKESMVKEGYGNEER